MSASSLCPSFDEPNENNCQSVSVRNLFTKHNPGPWTAYLQSGMLAVPLQCGINLTDRQSEVHPWFHRCRTPFCQSVQCRSGINELQLRNIEVHPRIDTAEQE